MTYYDYILWTHVIWIENAFNKSIYKRISFSHIFYIWHLSYYNCNNFDNVFVVRVNHCWSNTYKEVRVIFVIFTFLPFLYICTINIRRSCVLRRTYFVRLFIYTLDHFVLSDLNVKINQSLVTVDLAALKYIFLNAHNCTLSW